MAISYLCGTPRKAIVVEQAVAVQRATEINVIRLLLFVIDYHDK
jgi:hypothetical protein